METLRIVHTTDPTLISRALELALEVFMQFEAPDYPQEGIESFRHALSDPSYLAMLSHHVALRGDEVVGMLATRSERTHVTLFFVRADSHRQGIGRALMEEATAHCPASAMTVFSAPYAVKVYEALGFSATDTMQSADGISYLPMKKDIRQ